MRRTFFALLAAAMLAAFLPVQAQNYESGCVYNPEIDGKAPMRPRLETRDYKVLPSQYSLKKYCPYPKEQSEYNTCTSWAAIYAARTICEAVTRGWTNPDTITREAFSPLFIYKQVAGSPDCKEGSSIGESLGLLMDKGVPKLRQFDGLCVDSVPKDLYEDAIDNKIDGYSLIFNDFCDDKMDKVLLTKKALSQDRPVVVSLIRFNSLNETRDVWSGERDYQRGYHAMCVVGYDDKKFGGAFEVMNSWGSDWGNNGFTWIKYTDYCEVVRYAYDMYLKKKEPKALRSSHRMSGELTIVERDGKSDMKIYFDTVGELYHYYSDEDFMSGKRFRLSVGCNEPAWVYVIASDLHNDVQRLFPYSDYVSPYLNYTDSHIALPDETHEFELDTKAGTDYFCVLYSYEELDIKDIVRRMAISEGSFYRKLKTVLGYYLVPQKEINYSSDGIGFSSTSTMSVVPLVVEISHRDINNE